VYVIKSIINIFSDTLKQRSAADSVQAPVFPLGNVLFPGGTMSLKIFEPRYMDMAKQCLKNAVPFGIALISEGDEVGRPATPHPIGTLARIDDWDMPNLGVLEVRVKGEDRFRIIDQQLLPSGLLIANISLLETDAAPRWDEHSPCAEFLKNILIKLHPDSAPDEDRLQDASWVSFRLTELLPFNTSVKQKMLELTNAKMRLEVLHRFLEDQRLIPA
jgi:uncharacterized protein